MNRLLRVFASAALLVSIITLLTRLVGFARWLVFSNSVGAGTVGTAYQTANQVPNILFEVVAGGALAGAIIPLLAVPLARADTKSASHIASALLTWAITFTLPISIVLAVFAAPIAGLLVPAGKASLEPTIVLLLMFAPQLVLYGIGAVLTGILQAHRKFLWPAFTPLLSSLVVIGSYIAYRAVGGNDDSWVTHIGLLGWGTTAGVAALALPLALPMRQTGLRLSPRWSFPPGVAYRALRLAGAGMVTLLAQQGAVLATLTLSNHSGGDGTFPLFSYINAVYLLPYAVLAVPIATVMFPNFSTWVTRARDMDLGADLRQRSEERVKDLAATTSALIITIGLAGTVILFSAAVPLQAFFIAIDRASGEPGIPFTAMGVSIMVIALAVPGWSFVAWGTRVFYALERSRHTAIATATGWLLVIIGMVAAIWLTSAFGNAERTLAAICAGYVLGMSVAGILLLVSIRRVLGPRAVAGLARHGVHSLVAAAIGALVGVVASTALTGALGTGAAGSVIAGIGAALAGLVVFGIIMVLDRGYIRELRGLISSLRGRDDSEEFAAAASAASAAGEGPAGTSAPETSAPETERNDEQ